MVSPEQTARLFEDLQTGSPWETVHLIPNVGTYTIKGHVQESSNCSEIRAVGGKNKPRVHPGTLSTNPDPRVLRPPPITPASRAPSRPRLSRRSSQPEDTVDVVLQGRRHAAGPGGSGNLRGIGNKERKHRPPEPRPGSRPLANANIARF